eukprot:11187075-Ditylum_brightwellii.AAC.1
MKQHVFWYKTWRQLWDEFQKVEPSTANNIQNQNFPKECQRLLCKHVPWKMVKGKDASCLCTNCDSMNA